MKLSQSLSLFALIICLLSIMSVSSLDAQSTYDGPVWHVAVDGSDFTGDGSAIYPFATFQKAVNISNDNDTILVLPGIYSGEGNRLINISNKSSLVVMSQDGPLETILDLTPDSIYYRGFDIIADDSSYPRLQIRKQFQKRGLYQAGRRRHIKLRLPRQYTLPGRRNPLS
jgi:hypothetical protein